MLLTDVLLFNYYLQLSPSNSDMQEEYQRQVQEAKEYARKMSIVVLAEKTNNKEKDKDDKDREQVTPSSIIHECPLVNRAEYDCEIVGW